MWNLLVECVIVPFRVVKHFLFASMNIYEAIYFHEIIDAAHNIIRQTFPSPWANSHWSSAPDVHSSHWAYMLLVLLVMDLGDGCCVCYYRAWPFRRAKAPVLRQPFQGQSLKQVGIYLPRPVFTHGQLYDALSRVKSVDGLKILLPTIEQASTATTFNIVYKEIFHIVND